MSVSPDIILHTPFASLAAWRQEQEEAAAAAAEGAASPEQQQQGGEAMEVEAPSAARSKEGSSAEAAAAEDGSSAAAASPAQAAVQQQILGAVMEECLLNSRTEVRLAECRPCMRAGAAMLRGMAAPPGSPAGCKVAPTLAQAVWLQLPLAAALRSPTPNP